MVKNYSLFSYKKGNSLLHKCHPLIKMVGLFLLNILVIFLPLEFTVALVCLQMVTAFCLRFTFWEQLCDVKPVLFYAVMLFIFELISNGNIRDVNVDSYFFLVKILAVMQSASLVFKTTTSLEMKEGIALIFGRNSLFTVCIFMFLNFLPMISKIWTQCKKSWFARGGKIGLKMYVVLLPVLLSVGLKKAYNVSRAFLARK